MLSYNEFKVEVIKIDLFSKDKELILKITNGILVIWLLGAIIFTGNNLVNIMLKEPNMTYEEYESSYCVTKYEVEEENYCQRMYEDFKLNNRRDITYQKRNLYTSIINVIIVGTGIIIINRKKK